MRDKLMRVLVILLIFSGCMNDDSKSELEVIGIDINGLKIVRVDEFTSYLANVSYADNTRSIDVNWSVDSPEMAKIDSKGNFQALKEGKVNIIAEKSGYKSSKEIEINGKESLTMINDNENSSMGVNLGFITYYSDAWIFLNIFNESMNWVSQRVGGGEWNTGEEINYDENSWISSLNENQTAATLIRRANDGTYKTGRYVLSYEGEGYLTVGFNGKEIERTDGRIEFDVEEATSAGIIISLQSTNPDNYIRNIKIFEKRYEELINRGEVFYPEYLEYLKQFNTLRFMDFEATNNNPIEKWEDRSTPYSAKQSGSKGACLEYITQLSNQVHTNPWICIPHKADDTYIRKCAEYLRDNLDEDLKIYVEYSNEAWNWIFSQTSYMWDLGEAMEEVEVCHKNMGYYSIRSREIFAIFEEVFGNRDRFVRVAGAQVAWSHMVEDIFDQNEGYKYFDAIAVAPYFGVSDDQFKEGTVKETVDGILEACRESISIHEEKIRNHKELADKYGMDLIAYEGGQHLNFVFSSESTDERKDLFAQAKEHPGMKDIYLDYLNTWKSEGGDLFMHYKDIDTEWGLISDMYDYDDPKNTAVVDFMENNPKWW